VTQLRRNGAPGVPERIFQMYAPAEAMRAMNPQRGEPPLLVPDARYATAHVPFTPADLQAAARSLGVPQISGQRRSGATRAGDVDEILERRDSRSYPRSRLAGSQTCFGKAAPVS
jgi:hypothetical protein